MPENRTMMHRASLKMLLDDGHNSPPDRAMGGQDALGLRLEATGKFLRTRKAYRIRSGRGGLDLIPNLIPNFEKQGKHGIHGKVVVNERISLR